MTSMAKSPELPTSVTLILLLFQVEDVFMTCESPQYAEYGEKGIIKCHFISGSTGIYWYESVNSTFELAIRLEEPEDGTVVVSGNGYTEGTFDILSDGSLVITNVTKYDDRAFKVVHVDKNYLIKEVYVDFLTAIYPDPKFPLINLCNKNNLCLVEEIDSGILTCSSSHSKPPVELSWYRISHEGTYKLEGETVITKDGKWTFSSLLNANITSLINGPLIAFSCRASSSNLTLHFMESTVVIDSTKQPWPLLQVSVKEEENFLINSDAGVGCTDIAIPQFVVWKKLNKNSSDIIGIVVNGEKRFVSNQTTRWNIDNDGFLTFLDIDFENEGLYSCTFFDGTRYISNVKQVKVLVPPSPPTIIANGCSKDNNECEIFVRDTISPINISCHLFGVYPNVILSMNSSLYSGVQIISQNTYSLRKDKLYDTIITTEFSPIECSASINVTCFVSSPHSLTFIQDKVIAVRSEECEVPGSKVAVIIIAVILVVVVGSGILLFSLYFRQRIQNSPKENARSHELDPLKSGPQENRGGTQNTVNNGNSEDPSPLLTKEDSIKLMKEIVDLILAYPINYTTNNSIFDTRVITIIKDTPVEIRIKKDVSLAAKMVGITISAFGAALALVTFGFGAVLVVAGAALGLTGAAIGLSSKEIFEDKLKWRKVKPAFQTLIELHRDIAKVIALTRIAYNTIESFRKSEDDISNELVTEIHRQLENLLKIIRDQHRSKRGDSHQMLSSMVKHTDMVLEIFIFAHPSEINQLKIARDTPFNKLCQDTCRCLNNALTSRRTSSFLDFIEMLFLGDKGGGVQSTYNWDITTEKIKANITKIVKGVAVAGIILNAANVDTNMEFLGTTLENLLESKTDEHKTMALTDTADLMEQMNAIWDKLRHT